MRLSEEYRDLNTALHQKRPSYGASGHRWAKEVSHLEDILDYGCGKGTLAKELGRTISEYDPAIPGKDAEPEPHKHVVCTDVLEHIEPECLDEVLQHIASLMQESGLLVVATRPANKKLPDGRNAHLIIEPWAWWNKALNAHFNINKITVDAKQEGEFAVWVSPK